MCSVNHWNWKKSCFFFSCSTVRWNQPPCPLHRLAHMLCVWAASVIVRRATLRSRAAPTGRPEDVGHPSAHMSPPGRSLSFWLPELLWIREGDSSGGSYLTLTVNVVLTLLFSALCIQTKRVSVFLCLYYTIYILYLCWTIADMDVWRSYLIINAFHRACPAGQDDCALFQQLSAASQHGYRGAILSLQPVPPLSWRVNRNVLIWSMDLLVGNNI